MVLRLALFFSLALPLVLSGSSDAVVPATDGVPIHYSVQGKGDPALVFIHCGSCNRHLWDDQVHCVCQNSSSCHY